MKPKERSSSSSTCEELDTRLILCKWSMSLEQEQKSLSPQVSPISRKLAQFLEMLPDFQKISLISRQHMNVHFKTLYSSVGLGGVEFHRVPSHRCSCSTLTSDQASPSSSPLPTPSSPSLSLTSTSTALFIHWEYWGLKPSNLRMEILGLPQVRWLLTCLQAA